MAGRWARGTNFSAWLELKLEAQTDCGKLITAIAGKSVRGNTALDDILDAEGHQWSLGRRLAVWSRTQELALCVRNLVGAKDVKGFLGRGCFPKIVRKSLDDHPDVAQTPATKRADQGGRLRSGLAAIIAAVKRRTEGSVERLVLAALKLLDEDWGKLTTATSLGGAICNRAQRVIDAAAVATATEGELGPLLQEAARLMDTLGVMVRRAAKECAADARASFREWVEKAIAKGARLAHAHIKLRNGETALPNPFVLDGKLFQSIDDAVDCRSQQWADTWSKGSHSAPLARRKLLALLDRVRKQDRTLLEDEDILAGLSRLAPSRAVGSDATELPVIQKASPLALKEYAGIVREAQRVLAWPVQTRWSKMRSLPKPAGGDRAIALTSSFYAVYGAAKKPELELWRTSRAGFWDTALKGCSSLRAAVSRIVTAEVAAHRGELAIAAFGDFRAFYDSVEWDVLIDSCVQLDFPLELLGMSLLAYMAPRRFMLGNAIGCEIFPNCSVLAGCWGGSMWPGPCSMPSWSTSIGPLGRVFSPSRWMM